MSKPTDDFIEYIVGDVLSEVDGKITIRKMFGGCSLYLNGSIFGLITSDSELYFKVGDSNRDYYKQIDSHPFVYGGWKDKKRKPITMPYWYIPEEVMEDRELVVNLVHQSAAIGKK